MDKEKIMDELQQKMSEKYDDFEIVEHFNRLVLKFKGEILAHFRDWDADRYYMECGPNYTEWALSNGILLEFYKEGRKLLKKLIKKYRIRVLKGKSTVSDRSYFDRSYLNVNYRLNLVSVEDGEDFGEWRASFTKKEIEELKKRDDIAIDWDKVELEEVNNG